MKSFKSKVAVVTGAVSGIRQAIAAALAKEGRRLALVDINEQGLNKTARSLKHPGLAISTHVVDVTKRQAMMGLGVTRFNLG